MHLISYCIVYLVKLYCSYGFCIGMLILSFPVFTVQLRCIKWQYKGDDVMLHVKDGAIRDCSSLDKSYPTVVLMERSYSNAFFITVCLNYRFCFVGHACAGICH